MAEMTHRVVIGCQETATKAARTGHGTEVIKGRPFSTEGYVMMRISFLLPLVMLGLAGCVDVHEHPAPQPSATIVTPAPAPTATYVTPAPTTTTTVVRTP
jgi:hypothetical protein